VVVVNQTQSGDKLFQIPIAVDVYNGSNKKRHNVWLRNKADTFAFNAAAPPDLINFDADKIVLAQKTKTKPWTITCINTNMPATTSTGAKPLMPQPKNRKKAVQWNC
jgi:hypothetical protein